MSEASSIAACLSSCCCVLVARVAGATLVAFGIVALCGESNHDLRQTCAGTDLWWVLLVQVIIGAGEVLSSGGDNNDVVKACVRAAAVLGVAAWGLAQAQASCAREQLDDSKVWTMVMIWSVGAFGLLALVLVAGACGVLCAAKASTESRPAKSVVATLDLEEGTDHERDIDKGSLGASPPTSAFKSAV